ncbi:hypothetical protein KEJ47_02885 [Candidatus Bathyarchaeota archaeon]|nr:hypothetical protein [Candidatus Bathyarchaeota archaeon]
MDTKNISIIIVFTALTVVLNLSPFKIPAPYAPFLIYQIWEIPIVAVTLLYCFKTGIIISFVNTLVLLIVFPGALPTGPFYNLAAVLSMLFGIVSAVKLSSKSNRSSGLRELTASTGLGLALRVTAMTLINGTLLPYPPPLGFGIPFEIVTAYLPLIALFNATITLYTIPVGYALAKAVKKRGVLRSE